VLVRYASEEGGTGWLQDLFAGLVYQLSTDDETRARAAAIVSMTELAILAELEADHQAEVDEIAAGLNLAVPQRAAGREWKPMG
jgi:hypothetical protein